MRTNQPERCSRSAAVSAAHTVHTGQACVFAAVQNQALNEEPKRRARIALAGVERPEPPRRRRSANGIVPAEKTNEWVRRHARSGKTTLAKCGCGLNVTAFWKLS